MQGRGKSWNLLGSDADGGCNDVDTDAKICTFAHNNFKNCKKCSNSVFATFDSDNIYSSMDAVIALYIYMVSYRELQWGYYRGKSG